MTHVIFYIDHAHVLLDVRIISFARNFLLRTIQIIFEKIFIVFTYFLTLSEMPIAPAFQAALNTDSKWIQQHFYLIKLFLGR